MRKWLVLSYALALLGFLAIPAQPMFFNPPMFMPKPAAVGYSGPGDVVSGARFWFGLRAYTSALAGAGASTTPVVDVRGATTATSCTIFLLGNGTGGIDVTTSGAGGVGNQCASGATTFCSSTNTSCTVSKWYDQSGNAQHITQATAANQPKLVFSCIGSLPCVQFSGSPQTMASGVIATSATPFTISTVVQATSPGAQESLWFDGSFYQFGFRNSAANQVFVFGHSTLVTATASDNATHSITGIWSSSTGTIYVDNSATSGAVGTSDVLGSSFTIASAGGGQYLTGNIEELGQWSVTAFNSTQAGNMCHNQFVYWGTATSC